VIVTGDGFVTAAVPIALALGVTVTAYVCFAVIFDPHATSKDPPSEIDSTQRIRLVARFRRKINGSPIKAAKNSAPPLHGLAGALVACALAVIVTVEVPLPPAVRATGLAVAVTSAGVPLLELTLVVNETVPA